MTPPTRRQLAGRTNARTMNTTGESPSDHIVAEADPNVLIRTNLTTAPIASTTTEQVRNSDEQQASTLGPLCPFLAGPLRPLLLGPPCPHHLLRSDRSPSGDGQSENNNLESQDNNNMSNLSGRAEIRLAHDDQPGTSGIRIAHGDQPGTSGIRNLRTAAERKRSSRAAMSDEAREAERERNTQDKRTRRANQWDITHARMNAESTERMRTRRSLQTDEERAEVNEQRRAEYAAVESTIRGEVNEQRRTEYAAVESTIRAEVNEQRRTEYAAVESTIRVEINADRRADYAAVEPTVRVEINADRRADYAAVEPAIRENINAGRRQQRGQLYKAAVDDTPNTQPAMLHDLGRMNVACRDCSALHFPAEHGRLLHNCCHKGKAILPALRPYPAELRTLWTDDNEEAKHFRKFIMAYNNAFSFASFGAKVVQHAGHGPPTFTIRGEVYHNATTGLEQNQPAANGATYGQVYIYDPDHAARIRMQHPANRGCDNTIMIRLSQIMHDVSPYAAQYRRLHDVQEEIRRAGQTDRQVQLLFTRWKRDDQRRFNAPTTNTEIALLYQTGIDGELPQNVDIAVHPHDEHGYRRVSHLSRHIDPMIFPMFFPAGDPGWTPGYVSESRNTITCLQFYSNRIAFRFGDGSVVHFGGKLFLKYLVCAYLRVEADRLNYIRSNQKQLRVESYQGLLDHVNQLAVQEGGARVGNVVILPATFVGGPRFMTKLYQDSMAIVRSFGKPDLFITMTCNPNWSEIRNELAPRQQSWERPDLMARVFELKNEELLDDISKKHIFGESDCYISVIEAQKRGNLHSHTLSTNTERDKIRTTDQIDRVVCAEFPDPADQPLYGIISRHNVHGPCGTLDPNCVCMENGRCKKRFPKPFCDETEIANGLAIYRRRNNHDQNIIIRGSAVNDGFIVPYNRYLSVKYNAHINVEIVASAQRSTKYLYKYITKGHDCARVEVRQIADGADGNVVNHDEVRQYLECRYVGPHEAVWRLNESPIHYKSHPVIELSVHLPNAQSVYFVEGDEETALRRESSAKTTLTEWFRFNNEHPESRHLKYLDFPEHHVFTAKKVWQVRRRGGDRIVTRIPAVSPRNVELYHLRLLLLRVPGAISFESLRAVNDVILPTFREAAVALGLTEDDTEYIHTMEDGVALMMPHRLRNLFVMILVHCTPGDPLALWNRFVDAMCDDFIHQGQTREMAIACALFNIEQQLQREGTSCGVLGLPDPPTAEQIAFANDAIDVEMHRQEGERLMATLNAQQREIANAVLEHNQSVFVDGPGGTGKTYLYNTIIHAMLGRGRCVLAVAWTGIAAILLPGGLTCHKAFNLPLKIDSTTTAKLTQKAKARLNETDLIIWDEAPMASGDALMVVDRALRDVMDNELPFGGKIVVLGGDFRQTLPVVRHASRGQIVAKSLKRCSLWSHFRVMNLTRNERADANSAEFANWLLWLGNGTLPKVIGKNSENSIRLPNECLSNDLVRDLYGERHTVADAYDMSRRAILCPLNEHVALVNEDVVSRLDGDVHAYHSIDRVKATDGEDEDELQTRYPAEFLHSLNPPGLPPHVLNLKVGANVMLLRNMNIDHGLANGTRMIVRQMRRNLLLCEVVGGAHHGTLHMIPKISLETGTDPTTPFNHVRRQFPIRLAYAMTINKSQGQTLDRVGVLLLDPVFTHGQLYVACSRVRNIESLKIHVVNNDKQGTVPEVGTVTDNIVYPEVFA